MQPPIELAELFDWPDELAGDLTLLAGSPVVTGRFQYFRREVGVPVRTTVGAPKFWRPDRGGDLEFLPELAPYGVFRNPKYHDDPELMRVAYVARCEDHLVGVVRGLADLVRLHPGRQLCLLCFDDVHAGDWCHRRWFADWFKARFGIAVPELDRIGPARRTGISDYSGMQQIAALLTEREWTPEVLDAIAEVVRATGRKLNPLA